MRGLIALLLFVFAGLTVQAQAAARAWLDRDAMQLGETVTLNIEVEGNSGVEPDFSALAADFNSLGTQSSRQFSLVNGQSMAKTIWAIGLEPKRSGQLTIPAFVIGTETTAALGLNVLPAPDGGQGRAGDNVFIEVAAEPLSPYVQQQVRYTVKLHYAIDLTEGTIDEPSAGGIVAQKLGADRRYVATIGERRYHVLERRYALLPEHSGTLILPALGFRGTSPDTSDPTGFFRRGRAVSARSDAIELQVRAKPVDWGDAPWLPATSLSISEETALPDRAVVGEPLTRTLRMRAQGLGFEQLPELQLPALEGSEVYPDKPDLQTRDDGTWLFGESTRKFAIVPTRPGLLRLPAVEVKWFDTVSEREVKAILAAREIEIVAADSAAAATTPNAGAMPTQTTTLQALPFATGAAQTPSAGGWRLFAIGMVAVWLVTLALWWRARRAYASVAAVAVTQTSETGAGRSVFLRACALGDLAAAERGFVTWAREQRPDLHNLGATMAMLADDEQRAALSDLQRVRYAGVSIDGLGARLQRVFRPGIHWKSDGKARSAVADLPDLYPPAH